MSKTRETDEYPYTPVVKLEPQLVKFYRKQGLFLRMHDQWRDRIIDSMVLDGTKAKEAWVYVLREILASRIHVAPPHHYQASVLLNELLQRERDHALADPYGGYFKIILKSHTGKSTKPADLRDIHLAWHYLGTRTREEKIAIAYAPARSGRALAGNSIYDRMQVHHPFNMVEGIIARIEPGMEAALTQKYRATKDQVDPMITLVAHFIADNAIVPR